MSMSSSCFGSECFDSFFNSEALSDRILNIVEVEELCIIASTHTATSTTSPDIGEKRKRSTTVDGSSHGTPSASCSAIKKCLRDDMVGENCFPQFDDDVTVDNDVSPRDPIVNIDAPPPEHQQPTSSTAVVPEVHEQRQPVHVLDTITVGDTDVVVEPEMDLVDNQCEAVECKEEVADQIDDVVVCENEKNENEDNVMPPPQPYSLSNPVSVIEPKTPLVSKQLTRRGSLSGVGSSSVGGKMCSEGGTTPPGSPVKLHHPMTMLFENHGTPHQQSSHNDMEYMHTDDIIEKRILKETTVYVHSVILAAKSDYFACLFSTSGMKETKQQKVKVEVRKGETENMLILLHCFYNKNFINQHSLQTVLNVCPLAMRYCYDGLIDKCLDVFRVRAETLTEVDDVNQISSMVTKIQSELHQHKDKCIKVMKTFGPFLINTFYPLDVCLEKNPGKFFQLTLNSMYLLMDPHVQVRFNSDHGNLFVYAITRWLKNHTHMLQNHTFKAEIVLFIENLLCGININDLTGDFLTNIMTYEHCPFAIWPGYKEWYIKALQDFVYKYYACNNSITEKQYPIILRNRVLKFVRQERNADIFSLTSPIILNGFEIGIYLRAREDRKVQIIGKCKNMIVNKTGFDKASLTFNLKGTIKLNVDSNCWIEHFPSTQSNWLHEWLTFSYKQNLMCLQMYGVCKLSPAVYSLAKASGFVLTLELQQIR